MVFTNNSKLHIFVIPSNIKVTIILMSKKVGHFRIPRNARIKSTPAVWNHFIDTLTLKCALRRQAQRTVCVKKTRLVNVLPSATTISDSRRLEATHTSLRVDFSGSFTQRSHYISVNRGTALMINIVLSYVQKEVSIVFNWMLLRWYGHKSHKAQTGSAPAHVITRTNEKSLEHLSLGC